MKVSLVIALLLAAQPRPKARSVLDDFLALPQVGEVLPSEPEARRKAVEVLDEKNGFLSGKTEDGRFEVALFIRQDGRHLLGIHVAELDMGCPDRRPLRFFLFDGGACQEVTEQVWPRLTDAAVEAYVRSHATPEEIRGGATSQCSFDPGAVQWRVPRQGTRVVGDLLVGGGHIEVTWSRAQGRFTVAAPKALAKP